MQTQGNLVICWYRKGCAPRVCFVDDGVVQPVRDSYYYAAVTDFLKAQEDTIFGELARAHTFDLEQQQRHAWLFQIKTLKKQLSKHLQGYLFFEFSIPRMGKRVDVLLLYKGIIFVIEFKVGSKNFERYAIDQVHDYALDLKNFHLGSHTLHIVPILLATHAPSTITWQKVVWAKDGVATPMLSNADDLSALLQSFDTFGEINVREWCESRYQPTPTIIEAAQALYRDHDVSEISRSHADAVSLDVTARCIGEIIETSKRDKRKSICFITGVPGAGKTLAGLNIATIRAECHKDEHAVFLSGNHPLVVVLQEALARDRSRRKRLKINNTRQAAKQFIQLIHHFRDEYIKDTNAPFEKVVVFDEAQRAWTKEQVEFFMKRRGKDFNQSEPEFLISVMDRHPDWCTIICLIGGGQEIKPVETGILEWLIALKRNFPNWDVHASNVLKDKYYTIDKEAKKMLQGSNIKKHQGLHLAIPMRSFRAEQLNTFVSEVLEGEAHSARAVLEKFIDHYPIVLTRELNCARAWLRKQARGSERFGLVASSEGNRLRAEGLDVKEGIGSRNWAVHWYLNGKGDVRSSYYLEGVATQFESQGLELDWVGMCWEADLRRVCGEWQFRGFRGTKWQRFGQRPRQLCLLNSYRVLLTRARQGFVIFVPRGNCLDATRAPEFYDGTYEYLRECGVPPLNS